MQIERVQREFNEKTILQDQQMQRVKEKSLETAKEHIREVIRPRVDEIVAECVRKEIESRVHREASIRICASRFSASWSDRSYSTRAAHRTDPCGTAGRAPSVPAEDHRNQAGPLQLVRALVHLNACAHQTNSFFLNTTHSSDLPPAMPNTLHSVRHRTHEPLQTLYACPGRRTVKCNSTST